MHFEPRLWIFTKGVRLRIAAAALVGLAGVALGILRLALLGWLIAEIYAGTPFQDLLLPAGGIALAMLGRGLLEHWRTMIAHETAARVQGQLRRKLLAKLTVLGPGYVGAQRSGDLATTLVDGVEQLETYFGKFMPQLLVAGLTPLVIFAFAVFLDPLVAGVLVLFAFLALFGPALWSKMNARSAQARSRDYSAFAAELLDSIQGLATLKAFGRSQQRAAALEEKAQALFRSTMWVLSASALSRGISDTMIAVGTACALALGAYQVQSGAMSLAALLMLLMVGIELFRPMRDLRTVLHEGMVGLSAAHAIFRIFDAEPPLREGGQAVPDELPASIAIEGVRFAYPGTDRVILDGLDIDVAPGERIGLVGPSGVGKSSLVRLLLRFYDPDAGTVRIGGRDLRDLSFADIRSRIAVVQQDAYLFHGSIRENIALGRPDADDEALEAAARAAHIHDFVAGLPDGYDTLVGEKGIKLSGGQRQRIAIARALLRDAPILVLDEALSAVDAENEASIQAALDVLMRGRTTLILAHRLSSVIDCDRILVLEEGHVVEEGDHPALMAAGGLYARLMADQARDAEGQNDLLLEETRQEKEQPVRDDEEALNRTAAADMLGAPTEGIVAAEGLGWGRLSVVLMALIKPWWQRMSLTFLFGITRVVAFIGMGVISALIVMALKNDQPFEPLLPWLFVAAPLAGLLHWAESWLAHDVAFRLLAEMRIRIFRVLDRLAPAYLVRRRTGDLMGIATHDIELVEYFFAHTLVPAFVSLLVPTLVLAILAAHDVWLAAVLFPFLFGVAFSPWISRQKVDRLGSRAREAAGELAAHAVDSIQGLGEIVGNRQEADRVAQFEALSRRHVALRLPFFRELTAQHSQLEALTGLGGLAVVVVGGLQAQAGAIDPVVLPLLTLLALAAFLPVSEIAQVGRQLADTLGATRRVHAVDIEEPVVADGPGVPSAMKAAGADIGFEAVRFHYPGIRRPALDDISFAATRGQTIALVGPSGAGKTTMAQLLMRFWDPASGRVLLDGHDLRDYTLDEVRERTALVAQETYLFHDTLEANIRLARPDASAADLQAAIDNAALGDLVAQLPDGLATPVGERGARLSGGQRQRVAIARAFLKDAPVLILDEATSHLDAVNERLVREALDRLQQGRTTFVIAHRLSTVRSADRILVLDAGRLAEFGSHEELLARGGLYARLVSRQLGAAQGEAGRLRA